MSTTNKNTKGAEMTTKETAERYISLAIDNSPKQIQPYLKKATPFVLKLVDLIEILIPVLQKLHVQAMELWKKLEPYKPELLIPTFIGFVLCFFGGSFLTLIAAVEAWNMCGYESTSECLKVLWEDVKIVVEENKKDDKKDEDGDGVADVHQISNSEMLTRKTLLFLRVVDPNRVTAALGGITSGLMAVVAALKLQFAKTIALANAISVNLEKPADKHLLPHLEKLLPAEYKKWAKPVLHYSIKSVAVSVAWTLQRILSAVHSALRGGLMLSRNLLKYLSDMKYVHINPEETVLDEAVGYSVALLGLFFQLRFGYGLPFPLNILLLPFTIAEYILMAIVNK